MYLWYKYERFLMSGSWEIPHLRNFNASFGKLCLPRTWWTHEWMNIQKERWKLHIPWHKCWGIKNNVVCFNVSVLSYKFLKLTICILSSLAKNLHSKHCAETNIKPFNSQIFLMLQGNNFKQRFGKNDASLSLKYLLFSRMMNDIKQGFGVTLSFHTYRLLLLF